MAAGRASRRRAEQETKMFVSDSYRCVVCSGSYTRRFRLDLGQPNVRLGFPLRYAPPVFRRSIAGLLVPE